MAYIITKDLKSSIMKNVREKVTKTYFDGEVGEELRLLEDQLAQEVTKTLRTWYPESDVAVYEKYEDTCEVGNIRISKNLRSGELLVDNGVAQSVVFRGAEKFKIPSCEYSRRLRSRIISAHAEMFSRFFDLSDRINCEISAIISAYEVRLKYGFGVKRLLKEYPSMKEFLPKPEAAAKTPTPIKPTEMLVKEFERSLAV